MARSKPTNFKAMWPVGLMVLILLALLPARFNPVAQPLHQFSLYLIAPMTFWLSPIAQNARGWVDPPPQLDDRQRLAEQIQQLNARILNQQARIRQLRIENDRLRRMQQQLTGMNQQARLLAANVVARSPDLSSMTITLDRGTRNDLNSQSIVVDGAHLIGRITDVGPLSTATTLLSGRPFEAIALNENDQDLTRLSPDAIESLIDVSRLVLEPDEADPEQLVTPVERDSPIEPGYTVRLVDPDWPEAAQYLVVGRVVAVRPLEGQWKQLIIKPYRALRYISDVTIIVPLEPEDRSEP